MNRVVRKFASHAEAEKAERDYYRSLTPQQRIEILLELLGQQREGLGEAGERLARVYRVTQLKSR